MAQKKTTVPKLSNAAAFLAAKRRAPPLRPGYARSWFQCPKCKMYQHLDYVPYSLSNPVLTTACGHGLFRELRRMR